MVIVATAASLPGKSKKDNVIKCIYIVHQENPLEVANNLLLVLGILVRRTRHVPVTQSRLGGQSGLHLLDVVVGILEVEVLLISVIIRGAMGVLSAMPPKNSEID